MAQNLVTIKGMVEPQAVCEKIMKRTHKMAKVLFPLPSLEGEPIPEVMTSQGGDVFTSVELSVNMHCDACAQQLKRKILKIEGVKSVETYLSMEKMIVTGTMDESKLVDYVNRHTKKQPKTIPQPEPQEPEEKEETKPEDEKPSEDEKPAEVEETQKEETTVEKNIEPAENPPEEENKENVDGGGGDGDDNDSSNSENKKDGDEKGEEEERKKAGGDDNVVVVVDDEHSLIQRSMNVYIYSQPLYFIERIPPPPQLFSDENPNACCIT